MPLRSYKPTSAGIRFQTRSTFEEITTKEPYKPLLEAQQRISGRNNQGRMTVRHRGGGEKRFYRRIDFKRDKLDVPAKLATVEYDPNRSARIGLLHYADGEKRYMLVPNGLNVGDTVIAGSSAEAPPAKVIALFGEILWRRKSSVPHVHPLLFSEISRVLDHRSSVGRASQRSRSTWFDSPKPSRASPKRGRREPTEGTERDELRVLEPRADEGVGWDLHPDPGPPRRGWSAWSEGCRRPAPWNRSGPCSPRPDRGFRDLPG